MLYKSVAESVGNTPTFELTKIKEIKGLKADLFVKAEFFNPAGSSKDRVALQMILDGEQSGRITRDSVIIEPTSGNTGIGLAAVAVARGYRVIIVMPSTMSEERKKLISAYGAELVLSDGAQGMSGAIKKAEELASSIPSAVIAGQFTNPSNPKAHYLTTGPEILRDLGAIDVFVAGVGTGGTVSGVGKYLKEKLPSVKIVGVEPADSPYITKGQAGAHKLQGIGAGFIPETLDLTVVDEVVTATTDETYEAARLIGKTEGLLVGISSGAALSVAMKLAALPENEGKKIVALMPDGGARYLSTDLFD